MTTDNQNLEPEEFDPLTDEELGRLSEQAIEHLLSDQEFLATLIEKVKREPSFEIETRLIGQGLKTRQRVYFSMDMDMAEALGRHLKNTCPHNKALQSMFFQLLNARVLRDPSNLCYAPDKVPAK